MMGPNSKKPASINGGSFLLLLAESILGFVWWSTFVEFLSTLWYFPLEKMDFSGWEAFLAAYLLVMLVGLGFLRRLLQQHAALIRSLALLLALAAFYPWNTFNPPYPISLFPEANAARMVFVSLGVSVNLLVLLSLWWSSQPDRRERSSWGFLIGLILLLVVRLAWVTVNPFTLWKVPIILGAVAIVWAGFMLSSEVKSTVSYDLSIFTKWNEDSTRVALASPFSVGCGLASQLFITHLLYTSHGVTARYLDINPFPSGIFIIIALILGAFASNNESRVSSRGWFLSTAGLGTSLFLIGEYGDGHFLSYLGFFGSLLLGVYLSSSWTRVTSNFSSTARPGRAAAWFVLFYLLFTFWAVWVVAFKFIPWWLGSLILKERNRSMVALAVALSSLANTYWRKSNKTNNTDSDNKQRRTKSATRRNASVLLAIIFVFAFVPATVFRFSTSPRNVLPSNAEPGKPSVINGMIWNIHFGYDNFGRNNFYGIAEEIRQRKINVLGILESDTTRPITANIDVVEFLAEHLNMYSDFGPSTAKNTWGCGLLSSYPIEKLERIVLPSPEGELACLIDAIINVDGEPVTVLVTHFGNTEDVLDRKLQTEGFASAAKNSPNPVIALSYITDRPHSDNYYHILNVGGLTDTTTDLRRYCQYIFYRGLELVEFYRYNGGRLSDTEAQVGSWKLLPKK